MSKINIAGTLHNTEEIQDDALHSHVVVESSEVLDVTKSAKQSDVNADVQDQLDQHQSLITALDSQNYVTVTATSSTTDVSDLITDPDVATIYRVGKWNGTQYDTTTYSEYAYDGTSLVILDVKQYGIAEATDFTTRTTAGDAKLATVGSILDGADDEPTAGSGNLVKSGGVEDAIVNIQKYLKIPVAYSEESYSIMTNGKWGTAPGYKHAAVPVVTGETYWIEVLSGQSTRIAFATSNSFASNTDIDLVSGTSVISVNSSGLYRVEIIAGCSYLIFNVKTTSASQVGDLYKLDDAYKSAIFASGEKVIDTNISGTVADNNSLVKGSGVVSYVANTGVNNFPYIKNKVPAYSSTSSPKSFTLPSGTNIITTNSYVQLSSDVVFEKPNDGYSTHYLILDYSDSSVRYVKANVRTVSLSSTEVIVAMVDWNNDAIIKGNFKEYSIDGAVFHADTSVDDERAKDISCDATKSVVGPSLENLGVVCNIVHNSTKQEYVRLPVSIPAGTTVNIEFKSIVRDDDTAYFGVYGKTNKSDDTSFQFTGAAYGQTTITATVDREISYIRVSKNSLVISSYSYILKYGGAEYGTLKTEVASLKTEVDGLYEITDYDSGDLDSGKYYKLSGDTVTNGILSSWNRIRIKVNKDDIVTIKTLGGTQARAWGLADYDDNILSKADENVDTTQVPVIINVATNCYLYVNCKEDGLNSFEVSVKRLKGSEDNKIEVPCLFNPKVDLGKSNLKIFDIGNSYTNDATHYLPDIINAAGITADYSHYKAIRSSGSFKTWVDCYNDEDDTTYSISKSTGTDIGNISGTGSANDGSLFRTALAAKWDVILIHQVSSSANDFSVWEGNGNGGYLKEFIRILRHTNPQAAIGFLLIHSYRGTYSGNTEGSSLDRWNNIAKSTKEFAAKYGIDFVIPYGTAVQNLRATNLSDSNEFSTDGTHMADGIGDYVSACCYYQSLFAPRFGISIIGNTWRKTDLDETTDGVKNINDNNAVLAQKAAFLATYDWYNINNPEEVDLW